MRFRTHVIGLMALIATLLAGCGSTQTGSSATATAGMDHGAMATSTAMAGMDHGNMASSSAPYDATFIDSMIIHHQGAIDMAKQALQSAEHQEIKNLATAIIAAQQTEIAEMQQWRKSWYPDVATTSGMGMDMGDMQVSSDTSTPFDQRFIAAMIPHHEGAIAMAKDAQTKAEHGEIKDLAAAIITAQEGEIVQMKQWQKEWFGQ